MSIPVLDWVFLGVVLLFFLAMFVVDRVLMRGLGTVHPDPGENIDWVARARRQQQREEV